MSAGLSKHNTVNLTDLSSFSDGETVTLEELESRRILNISGRETALPLKVCYAGIGGLPSCRTDWLELRLLAEQTLYQVALVC